MNNLKTRLSKVLWKKSLCDRRQCLMTPGTTVLVNFLIFFFVAVVRKIQLWYSFYYLLTSRFAVQDQSNSVTFNSTINEFFWSHSLYKFDISSKCAERFPFSVDQYHTLLWLNYEGFKRRNFRPICPCRMQINKFKMYRIYTVIRMGTKLRSWLWKENIHREFWEKICSAERFDMKGQEAKEEIK